MDYATLAAPEIITKTIAALKSNGIEAEPVESGLAAKQKVLAMIPQGAQIMTMSSVTIETLGLSEELNNSGKYNSVRKQFASMNRQTQHLEMNQLGGAPEWAIGSVHAVTTDGQLLIASNSGSQLGAYAYGAAHVVFIVGTQKIVKDFATGLKRIYDYVLPLESERANKAYHSMAGSSVSKLLIINQEIQPGRITVIFVSEKLGF